MTGRAAIERGICSCEPVAPASPFSAAGAAPDDSLQLAWQPTAEAKANAMSRRCIRDHTYT